MGHPQGYGFARFKGARLSLSWLPKFNAHFNFNLNLNYPPRSGFSGTISLPQTFHLPLSTSRHSLSSIFHLLSPAKHGAPWQKPREWPRRPSLKECRPALSKKMISRWWRCSGFLTTDLGMDFFTRKLKGGDYCLRIWRQTQREIPIKTVLVSAEKSSDCP